MWGAYAKEAESSTFGKTKSEGTLPDARKSGGHLPKSGWHLLTITAELPQYAQTAKREHQRASTFRLG